MEFSSLSDAELCCIEGGGFYEIWMGAMEVITVASVTAAATALTGGNTVAGALAAYGTEKAWSAVYGDSLLDKVKK